MSPGNRPLLDHEDRIVVPASAQTAWDTIKSFDSIHTWHPAAVSTELLVGENGEPLAVREFQTADGGFVISELLDYDEDSKWFKYRIIKTSVPLRGYVGEMKVTPRDDGGSEVAWSAQFEALPDGEAMTREVVQTVFRAGLDNLQVILS